MKNTSQKYRTWKPFVRHYTSFPYSSYIKTVTTRNIYTQPLTKHVLSAIYCSP
jgi:hypothetical protein